MKISAYTLLKFAILLSYFFLQNTSALANDTYQLAQSATWHKLMLYEADSHSPSGLKSAIHSTDFFLAKDGNINPTAELEATIKAITSPVQAGRHDEHAKCRFPARFMWLREFITDKKEFLDPIDCPALSAWSDIENTNSISLIFANGFLENPASYFGHTFLKFNNDKNKSESELSDTTLNFGAILEKKDDPVSYIIKGLTGGYDGGFSPIEFYFHTSTYGEQELRDLWEYRLKLPRPAMRMIIYHAWEVMHKKYTYYFFKKNCAYRIAELIQILDEIPPLEEHTPWLVPQKLVQHFSRIKYKNEPLISEIIYHPSRQTRLYEKYLDLTQEEKKLLKQLSKKEISFENNTLSTIPLERRQAIIDTLIDYHQFNMAKVRNKQNSKKTSPEYLSALAARLDMPSGKPNIATRPSESPDKGRPPSWIQFGITKIEKNEQSQTLRIRPAYYDNLDASSGQIKHGSLGMGEIQLVNQHGRLSLRQLDLIAIDSVNPAITGLPGDQGFNWKLKAGLEQEHPSCHHCTVGRLQGDMGLGMQITPSTYFSIYSGGAIQESRKDYGNAFFRISGNLLIRPTKDFSLKISQEWRKNKNANMRINRISTIESRLALNLDHDIRLSWEQDGRTRVNLGIGSYW